MSSSRRDFIKASAMASGALLTTGVTQVATAQTAELKIIDTHQHLWDLVLYQPPWLKNADAKISSKHGPSEYEKSTAGLNVVKAIYMEVDAAVADEVREAEYVLDLIRSKKTPTVAAVISGRPALESFAQYIARFKDEPAIKGVRQVLHSGDAPKGYCLDGQFTKSIQLLGSMGKSFDLCMRPTELADGLTLVEKCPETRFIVDHCGNADPHAWGKGNRDVKPSHTVDQWKRDMEALAKVPRVVCKISGIVARMPEGWTAEDLAPAINFCLDAFGPERVMFGGDWPVCKLGASYAQWVSGLKEIVRTRPQADQVKLFHDNAAKFYSV